MSGLASDISGRSGVPSVERTSRYDGLLAAIPLTLCAAAAVGALGDVPFHAALGAGSLLSAVAIADALFVDPPV